MILQYHLIYQNIIRRYHEYGKTINELIKDSKFNNPNWRYDTPVSSDLPKYNIP